MALRAPDPERLAAHLRAFIGAKQHDELFSQGGCFHFAYRAWKKGIGTLHCTVSAFDPTKADHVFVVLPNGLVLDRLGYRSAHDLLEERKSDPGQNRAMTAEEVEAHLNSMGIPQALHDEMFAISDGLIAEMKIGVEPSTRLMREVSKIPLPTYAANQDGKVYYFDPSAAEIQQAIDAGELEERGYQQHLAQLVSEWQTGAKGDASKFYHLQKEYHARRIAYFAVHGWTDPIVLAANGDMIEGTHRLKAAIHKGMSKVGVRISR